MMREILLNPMPVTHLLALAIHVQQAQQGALLMLPNAYAHQVKHMTMPKNHASVMIQNYRDNLY